MSDYHSSARVRCVGHSRCRRSGAGHGARSESSDDSPPRRSSRPESPTTQESTYNLVAIPPVLPCWLHIKREHHPILDGYVGSPRRPGRRADRPPNSGPRRRPGISSNRCTQIGEQPKKLFCQLVRRQLLEIVSTHDQGVSTNG